MAGIIATGAYIPCFRLPRDTIAQAWGRGSLGGEKAVAGPDEDSLTMAVEAAMDCLGGADRDQVDALFFASTTAPYKEKQTAALLAAAVDLPDDIATADFANSLRSGAAALRAAFGAVASGQARSAMVVASDCRMGYPRSDQEQAFGDAAAAVLVANADGATLAASYSINDAAMDVWRKHDDNFVHTWEDRWVTGEIWQPNVSRALRGVLEHAGLAVDDLHGLVLNGAGAAAQARFVKSLGLAPDKWQGNFAATVGDAGAAHPLLGLVAALQVTPAGGRVAVVASGDGADALVFTAANKPPFSGKRGIEGFLSSKLPAPSYQRYLAQRDLVEILPGEPFRLLPSATASWREESSILRCHGSRCRQCGTVTFPIQRVCYTCRAKDDLDEVRLSDDRGTVFTYSIDNLAGRGDDPVVVQTVVEMDDSKARFYGLMTDCEPNKARVGMLVELTFRRMYEGAGYYNYFWKCRPIRGGAK